MFKRKVASNLHLWFSLGYSLLFVLSVLFIVPRYLSGNFGLLVALLTDTEPEGQFVAPFFSALIWILIPLTSIGFCVLSWLAYSASNTSTKGSRLPKVAGTMFFVASFLPAILVVRELLVYRIFDVALSAANDPSTDLILSLKSILGANLLFGLGTWGVPIIIFVETGLFFGFFLPGDSLLLTVGVLASAGHADLMFLIPITIMAAILGNQLGYAIGRRSGNALAQRYGFVQNKMGRVIEFCSKHGGKAVVLARFVPVVRTFVPIVAGAGGMRYSRFTLFNVAGGVLWVLSVILAGYVLGTQVPNVANYLNPMILVLILASSLVWMFASIWTRSKMEPRENNGLMFGS